jgi:hypothetical protein
VVRFSEEVTQEKQLSFRLPKSVLHSFTVWNML